MVLAIAKWRDLSGDNVLVAHHSSDCRKAMWAAILVDRWLR